MADGNHAVERAEVMAYLDGELSVNEAAKAAAHLERCPQCQKVAAELRDLSQELTCWQIPSTDTQIKPAVAAALDERERTPHSTMPSSQKGWHRLLGLGPLPRLVLGAAGAGLALLLLMFALPLTQHRPAKTESRGGDRDRLDVNGEPMQAFSADHVMAVPGSSGSAQGVVGGVPGGVGGVLGAARSQVPEAPRNSLDVTTPMIARTAQLALISRDFDKARAGLDLILKRHDGYVGELSVSSPMGAERRLTATLHVPAEQLEATLTELKSLGRVNSESQSGEEVTTQYVDLEARLTNARNTEKRLTDLLRQQTGKLADVLAVEVEISRVRGEIETMEAERKVLTKRVAYATLNATITEDYKAQLQVVPPSIGTLFSNAAVDGYQSVVNGVVSVLLFVMSWGPSILLWGVVLLLPLFFVWRRWRRKAAV